MLSLVFLYPAPAEDEKFPEGIYMGDKQGEWKCQQSKRRVLKLLAFLEQQSVPRVTPREGQT